MTYSIIKYENREKIKNKIVSENLSAGQLCEFNAFASKIK